jgi:class 3 adenylate cyclase/HAMP domain-containing protein
LFVILATVALVVLAGLAVVATHLTRVQTEIATLRDNALPRLIKLSQLSQESAASIAIAPALSTNPTRFEFETLLSRIKDKEGSQEELIAGLGALIRDEEAVRRLKNNSDMLAENQQTLTKVVRQQIDVRKRLEKHGEKLRKLARSLSGDFSGPEPVIRIRQSTATNISKILNTLLDSNQARFSRNKKEIEAGIATLDRLVNDAATLALGKSVEMAPAVREFREYWSSQNDRIFRDKSDQLTNEFKIKALVEENSLIANRLLSGASNEFWRTSSQLTSQVQLVVSATRYNLIAMGIVVAAFAAGGLYLWLTLQRRVFRRLYRIRNALKAFAEDRNRTLVDPVQDEIGEISRALAGYMGAIEERESELSKKTTALEQLSSKLAKYLSPQVYDSIFTGKQEVKVASSRKKLTIFFSDIAGFTETADRMESEDLTLLLNTYLTEMSRIALEYGATIDKYVGDAILIFFGDPETRGVKEDALACVKMAIAMRDRLRDLEEIWRQSGIEKPLNCRIGIHTGFCTVGNFGSESRMDYTIIGGAVNTASRLESTAQPGHILISYETFAHVRDEIQCQEHGEIEVKGIAYPVATYLVADSHEKLRRRQHRFREEGRGLKIDMDLDAMTAIEKQRAVDILHRALGSLGDANADHQRKPSDH